MLCPELNGKNMVSIPLDVEEEVTIGYIKVTNNTLNHKVREYVKKLEETTGEMNK